MSDDKSTDRHQSSMLCKDVLWLEKDAELEIGDLLMITNHVNYDIEDARVEQDLGREMYTLRGVKTRKRYTVRKAKRKVARANGSFNLVEKIPNTQRWIIKDKDWTWARAARRPIQPQTEAEKPAVATNSQ